MPATILIIDDESDLSATLEFAFDRAGWRAAAADDGAAGLSAARQLRPDLILLDMMLPDMQGTEVCRALRMDPVFSRTPIVFLSARDGEDDITYARAAGGDDYLTKPFRLDALVRRVARHLDDGAHRAARA